MLKFIFHPIYSRLLRLLKQIKRGKPGFKTRIIKELINKTVEESLLVRKNFFFSFGQDNKNKNIRVFSGITFETINNDVEVIFNYLHNNYTEEYIKDYNWGLVLQKGGDALAFHLSFLPLAFIQPPVSRYCV